MFRFTAPAPRALAASAAFILFAATATAQATSSTPTRSSRRQNANRQARIARNIADAYSHRWEVAGGGGFLRFRTGQNLQKISEVNFFMNANYQLSPTLGIVGDVRGFYGNANIPNLYVKNGVYSPQISEYTFMAGPQYRFYAKEKYTLSANAVAGVAMSKFGGDAKGLRSEDLGMWPDSNAKFAYSLSVIADYNIYNNLAVRVQPTYVGTTFGGTVQNNLGVQAGVVYRFGRQSKR
ncbi:hypothetical protein [Terriglobus roseus]|uniref:Opacity protein n=1 Tax=Terriglobus roseus TaxID=392734 RepID=A0A1G7K7M9_9BACT|nr:hypothetical protein [Terriglobus roseus]SDF32964.1 Opacity protein [Terriglobus roseus]